MKRNSITWISFTLCIILTFSNGFRGHGNRIKQASWKQINKRNIDYNREGGRLPRASDVSSHQPNHSHNQDDAGDSMNQGLGHEGSMMGHSNHQTDGNGNESEHGHKEGAHGIHVASWKFYYVETPYLVVGFMFIAALVKLGFHHTPYLATIIPESCVLILLGVIVGVVLRSYHTDHAFLKLFRPYLFFLFLLPPIILESAYSLHDRVFLENIGTIILYAVIGTVLNCFVIGSLLILLAHIGAMGSINVTAVQCLVFSALIVAVDPVAVLAIFQEIGVNNVLYFLVFGESLLNDAVTVVLYTMMKAFMEMESIPASQVFLGLAAFLCVSLGGLCIGIVLGLLTAFITKFTDQVRVVEPLVCLVLAYIAYLQAEMFHFSGIISIIGCGLVQAQYAFHNISFKSFTTVTYFTKMLSAMCDCIIFLFLGVALARDHTWHPGFIIWSLFLCIAVRFAVVYLLTYLANRLDRVRIIGWQEQFIMAYGGLRGAVAFALVAMLDDEDPKEMFMTATLVIIMFTVFVQGISIKPLVRLLNIKSEDKQIRLYDEVNSHVTDHIMAGIEEIIGVYGQNFVREFIDRLDDKYLKVWFQKDPQSKDDYIMELYEKIALQQHYEGILGSPDAMERYTSVMDLYQPQLMDYEKERLSILPPLDPEVMNMTVEMMSRRRSTAVPGVIRAADKRKGSILPVPESGRKTSEVKDSVPDKRRKSSARDAEQPPSATQRRRSTLAVVLLNKQRTLDEDLENPTAKDLRKWMVKNPRNQLIHRKFDKNLQNEADRDLLHHLYDKQLRNDRYMRHMSLAFSRSPVSSEQSLHSPTRSPAASPRFKKILFKPVLPVIPGGSPDPRRLPPGERPRFKRSPIVRAHTVDVPSAEEKLKVWDEHEKAENLFRRNKPHVQDMDRHYRRSLPEEPPQETILESPEENIPDSSEGSPSVPVKHEVKVFPTEEAISHRMPSRRSPRAPLFRGYTLAAPDIYVQDEDEPEPSPDEAKTSQGDNGLPPIQESSDSQSVASEDSGRMGSGESLTLPAITLPHSDISQGEPTRSSPQADSPSDSPCSVSEKQADNLAERAEGQTNATTEKVEEDAGPSSSKIDDIPRTKSSVLETEEAASIDDRTDDYSKTSDTDLESEKTAQQEHGDPQEMEKHAPQRGPSLLQQGRQRSVSEDGS